MAIDVAVGGAASGLSVVHETLWSSDPRVGLDGTISADQTVKLQAFLDLVATATTNRDKVGYLIPGAYNKSAELKLNNTSGTVAMRIVGGGGRGQQNAASVIKDTTDSGAGKYALNVVGPNQFSLEGLSFHGTSANPAGGADFYLMRGVLLSTECTVRDVTVRGFASGFSVSGDHILVEDFNVQGNAYGIEFPPNVTTQGDIQFRRGLANTCSKAGIGVARSGAMGGVRMEDVALSNNPYCILRYDDGTGISASTWITGCEFRNIATEYTGNGVVYDAVGDGVQIAGVVFDHGDGNFGLYTSQYAWAGKPQVAAWYNSGAISDVTFVTSLPSAATNNASQACPAILAPAITRVLCPDATGVPGESANGIYICALTGNQNGSHLAGTAFGDKRGYRTCVVPYVTDVSDGAVTLGYCVTPLNAYNVGQYSGSGRVLGIAAHTQAAGTSSQAQVVHVVENGNPVTVVNTSGSTIAANALLMPHSGGGVQTGVYGSGQIIGRALASIAAAATGTAEIHV